MEAPIERVLIVDEDESVRRLLRGALATEGLEGVCASNAEEARDVFDRGEQIDLALADVDSPEGPSGEFVLHVSREHPRVALVIMTARPCFENAQLALRSRASEYLTKPFQDLSSVVKRVRRILVERRSQMENARLLKELAEKNRELQNEKDLLSRKIDVTQRNLREQMRSIQKSREIFFTDLSRVMAIIDNLVDGIVFTDPEGKVILINPSAGKMLRIPSFTALGRTLGEIDGAPQLRSVLSAHREEQLPEEGLLADVSATTESGSTAYYSVQTNQIHDVNGKLSGLLSLVRDVSLRKKTEHLQNQFLSIVAHELRTPLTAIKAFATILDKGIHGELPDAQKSMVQSIISQTDRLGHEIDKIINLGRLEVSDFSPDTTGVPVQDILKKLAVPFQGQAKEKGLELIVDEGPADVDVQGDLRDIRRALQALVENALKFTPAGGTVEIRTVTEADSVIFEVRDTGIGIAPEDHEIIFEKFTQLENPLTRKFGGSGLGLSFASGILRAHGSRIHVESELGRGATFSFRLQRMPEDLRKELVAAASAAGSEEVLEEDQA